MSRETAFTTVPWLQRIPTDWAVVPAKSLFVERKQNNLPQDVHLTPSQAHGVVTQVRYMEITGGRVVLNLSGQDSMKHVEPDDFIIHLRSFQGGLERSALSGKVSTAYTVLSPRAACVPSFFRWVLKSSGYIQELRTTTNQLRDGQSIKFADFAKVPLPLPPTREQREIAIFLDRETARIDELIGKQEQLIATLGERRAAAVQAALDSLGTRETRLKHHAVVQSGVTLNGDGAVDDPFWPYLRVANVQTGYIDTEVVKEVRVDAPTARASMLRRGDVLMTEGGDIDKLGRGAVWDGRIDPCLHQNHVFAVRPALSLDPDFLVYLLDGARARTYFRLTARKTTNLASTNKWNVGNLPLVVPPREIQGQVVAELDDVTGKIDALIGKAQQFISLAKERRFALITAAVTGQIDVREAS